MFWSLIHLDLFLVCNFIFLIFIFIFHTGSHIPQQYLLSSTNVICATSSTTCNVAFIIYQVKFSGVRRVGFKNFNFAPLNYLLTPSPNLYSYCISNWFCYLERINIFSILSLSIHECGISSYLKSSFMSFNKLSVFCKKFLIILVVTSGIQNTTDFYRHPLYPATLFYTIVSNSLSTEWLVLSV